MRPLTVAVALSLSAPLACGGNVAVDGAAGGSTSTMTAITATGGAGGGGGACGTTQCSPGFVCLHHIGGPIETMPEVCIPNPCGTSPLSCSCATSVCPTGDGYTCAVTDGALVCGCSFCK